jgi:hypothetical protein
VGRLRLIALGAALAFFFDPVSGKKRRKGLVKRLAALRERAQSKAGGAGSGELSDDLVAETRKAESGAEADASVGTQ